ncbi:MAG: hypothetical protein KIT84_15535 [Labilithrix sp.]|nr:hypothetical protein [Labilithrix sp.]MCW5812438.1 hypothetical protein [Labilithrix sp.]
MSEERGAASTLKGRLADVYVPALVSNALPALSKRLGNRATIDDPLFGRASTLSSIDPLLERFAAHFKGATYRHVASATGVDRDVSEGVLTRGGADVPIAVVAERRRLREIELRLYYTSGQNERRARAPMLEANPDAAVPQVVLHVLDALRKGAVERVLAAFEASARFVDPDGKAYAKKDGSMAAFVSDVGSRMQIAPAGAADDGRCCCVEAVISRTRPTGDPEPAALTFERGDSGLLRELRFYYEP